MSVQEELTQLRNQIMNDVVPLVIESETGSDRFDILIRIIQSGGAAPDIYRKAYESAKKLENKDEKLDALMALVDEIDFHAEPTEVPQASEAPVEPQPAEPLNQPQDQPQG
jgi:hypothetical protein